MAVRQPRMVVPLAVSLGLHSLGFAALFVGARLSWPRSPIPIEILSLYRTQKAIGAEERRGDPRAEKAAPTVEPAARVHQRERPGPAPAPPRAPPPETADLRPFAPDDAHLVVLLRSDKLRESPHRAGVVAVLESLPDYRMLLDGTGLKPIDDFEAILIATADPHDVTATFLAARFRDSARIREVASRTIRPGDPRVFRILAPGLAVLTQPADATRLDGAGASDGGAKSDPSARWRGELERFDRVARDQGGPAVVVTLAGAASLIRLGDGLPTPVDVALAATADAAPSVRVQLTFVGSDEAAAFAAAWPLIVQRWRSRTALLGLGPALDQLELTRVGARLELAGAIPEAQVRIALSFASVLRPR